MHVKLGRSFWIVLVAIALASIGLPSEAQEKSSSQKKVAVVNGSVITQADFDRAMTDTQQRLSSTGSPLTDSQLPEIKRKTLEWLIGGELLYQESQKKGINVDEAATNEQLKKLKERFSSEDEFEKRLSNMSLSEALLKSQLKRSMAIQQLIEKVIIKNVTVSEKEIKGYYDGHPDSFKQPEQVRASHILIKVDPQAEESQKAEARKTLEKIQQKLKKGEDFSTLAKEFSQCPSNANGGDLGYFSRGQMVKPFQEAAFALRPGEVSDIVETRFGYHLIKVIDRRPEATILYKDAKDRIEQRLKQKKVQEEVSLYVAKLKDKAKVERFMPEGPS
jgi:peptidyl-prolyl cis-trans isomerase C